MTINNPLDEEKLKFCEEKGNELAAEIHKTIQSFIHENRNIIIGEQKTYFLLSILSSICAIIPAYVNAIEGFSNREEILDGIVQRMRFFIKK